MDDVVQSFAAVSELINAAGRAMVVVVEDAHDADATTFAALERVMQGPRGALVICTSWPTAVKAQRVAGEGFGAWLETRAGSQHETHELSPLAEDDLVDLTLATASEQPPEARSRSAARTLASRASHNPLLLLHLLEIAQANRLGLRNADIHLLASMPTDARAVFERYWTDFLGAAHAVLRAAAITGTPVHERMLLAAGRASAPDSQTIGDSLAAAVAAGWMTFEVDPYGGDRTVRFVERQYADVSLEHAALLVTARWTDTKRAGVEAAVEASTGSSARSRRNAVELALRLVGDLPNEERAAYEVVLYSELASSLWQRDPHGAARALQRAVELSVTVDPTSTPDLVENASTAWQRAGDLDRALGVYEAVGSPAYARAARRLVDLGHYARAVTLSFKALDAVAEDPSMIILPVPLEKEADPVALLLTIATSAAVMAQDGALRAAVANRAMLEMARAHRDGRAEEVREIYIVVEGSDMLPPVDKMLAHVWFDLAVVDEDDSPAVEHEPPSADDLAHAALVHAGIGRPNAAFELALAADQLAPGEHDELLVGRAMSAGEHALAREKLGTALAKARETLSDDHPAVLRLMTDHAKALAACGDREALAVARRALEVANAEGDEMARARALIAQASALAEFGARERARDLFRDAVTACSAVAESTASGLEASIAREAKSHLCREFAREEDWDEVRALAADSDPISVWGRQLACWQTIAGYRVEGAFKTVLPARPEERTLAAAYAEADAWVTRTLAKLLHDPNRDPGVVPSLEALVGESDADDEWVALFEFAATAPRVEERMLPDARDPEFPTLVAAVGARWRSAAESHPSPDSLRRFVHSRLGRKFDANPLVDAAFDWDAADDPSTES